MSVLFVSVRPQARAADAEYTSFREATGLEADELAHHDLVREPLPADAFARHCGFLVGGSPFNVTDPEDAKSAAQRRVEEELIRLAEAAHDGRTAAMFTCYGIGVVTGRFGGTVDRGHPENTSAALIRLTPEGRNDPVTGVLTEDFWALTAHKESTAELPEGAVLLAGNDACPVQAYRIGTHLYATQFHPEPTPAAFAARMEFYRDGGYFAPAEFDAVAARVTAAAVTEPPRLLARFVQLALRGDQVRGISASPG